jgi:hypothetical protein
MTNSHNPLHLPEVEKALTWIKDSETMLKKTPDDPYFSGIVTGMQIAEVTLMHAINTDYKNQHSPNYIAPALKENVPPISEKYDSQALFSYCEMKMIHRAVEVMRLRKDPLDSRDWDQLYMHLTKLI